MVRYREHIETDVVEADARPTAAAEIARLPCAAKRKISYHGIIPAATAEGSPV